VRTAAKPVASNDAGTQHEHCDQYDGGVFHLHCNIPDQRTDRKFDGKSLQLVACRVKSFGHKQPLDECHLENSGLWRTVRGPSDSSILTDSG